MSQLLGPSDGRGRQRIPAIPKLGIYNIGATLSYNGLTARCFTGNGSITTAGDKVDPVIAKATVLVGILVSEVYAKAVYEELVTVWRDAIKPGTVKEWPSGKQPRALRGKALDTVNPNAQPGKIVQWNSREYTYFKTDMVTWYQVLSAMQAIYTYYSDTAVDEVLEPNDRRPKPVVEQIIVGLAQYEMQKGKLVLRKRPGRRIRIGNWAPVLTLESKLYEPKDMRGAAPYIGAFAYALREAYQGVVTGGDWFDWCAIACMLLYCNNPGGKPSIVDKLDASDILETIFDYIGQELSESYRWVGIHENWFEQAILGAFCYMRQGLLTTEANLVKPGGYGSPITARGETGYVFEHVAYHKFSGGNNVFFPPAKNTSGDRYLIPSYCYVTRKPDNDKGDVELDIVQADLIPEPTRIDLKHNETASGALEIERDRTKEIRWVPIPDVRCTIEERKYETRIKWRAPKPDAPKPLETFLAKFTGGETHGKHGYYMPDRTISPWADVRIVTPKGAISALTNQDVRDETGGQAIVEGELSGGAMVQGPPPPPRGPGSDALPPVGDLKPGATAKGPIPGTQGTEGIET